MDSQQATHAPGMRDTLDAGTDMPRDQKATKAETAEISSNTNSLSAANKDALNQAEAAIAAYKMSFTKAGEALEAIAVGRLYIEQHESFEDYCRERWGFTPQRASQLRLAAKLAKNIATAVATSNLPKPSSEGQIRPLTTLAHPEEDAQTVWEIAAELAEGGPITARSVQEAISSTGVELKKKRPKEPKTVTMAAYLRRVNALESSTKKLLDTLPQVVLTKAHTRSVRSKIAKAVQLLGEAASKLQPGKSKPTVAPAAD